ncbi:hypothetical protein B0H17DRAFT_1190962 [Mycena rosella]|uniref:Uncharacterized protein n=1 Tax=Mycena rosella TaxID=1033263 RepID=A0AAD7MBP6_MYCRO|nr:hypothetical protein B0H17DRAFT_1190962 [Mycena rosella]
MGQLESFEKGNPAQGLATCLVRDGSAREARAADARFLVGDRPEPRRETQTNTDTQVFAGTSSLPHRVHVGHWDPAETIFFAFALLLPSPDGPQMAGKRGNTKRVVTARSYAGTLRSMAVSEPPEDPTQLKPQQIAEQTPLNPTAANDPPSTGESLRPAIDDWETHTIFGPLGLRRAAKIGELAYEDDDDDDPDPFRLDDSPAGQRRTPQSSPSKGARERSVRIRVQKVATAIAMPTNPVLPPAATPKRRGRQPTTPRTTAKKPAPKRPQKSAVRTAPAISIDQADAATAAVRPERRVSFSASVTQATPTNIADYDMQFPPLSPTNSRTPGNTAHHASPGSPRYSEVSASNNERFSFTRTELENLVASATAKAMANLSSSGKEASGKPPSLSSQQFVGSTPMNGVSLFPFPPSCAAPPGTQWIRSHTPAHPHTCTPAHPHTCTPAHPHTAYPHTRTAHPTPAPPPIAHPYRAALYPC